MPVGVVKWFDPERGVGRVVMDGAGLDAVACRSAVQGPGEGALVAGEPVEFDLTMDAAGIRADNICRLAPPRR
ncbi:cold-shock protein [Streptomyces sp. NPDC002076]